MVPEDSSPDVARPSGSGNDTPPPGFTSLQSQGDGRYDEPLSVDVNITHNFDDILKDIVGEGNFLMLPENVTKDGLRDPTAPTWAKWSQTSTIESKSPIRDLDDILNEISGSDLDDLSSSTADTSTDSSADVAYHGSKSNSWLSQEDRIWSVGDTTSEISTADISSHQEFDGSALELQGLAELIDAMPRDFENPVAKQLDDNTYGNPDIIGSPPTISNSPVRESRNKPSSHLYQQHSNSYFSTPVRVRDRFMGYEEPQMDNASPYERFLRSVASCKTCKQAIKSLDLSTDSGKDDIVGSTEWLTGLSGGILGEISANTSKPRSKRMASFSQGADPSHLPLVDRTRHLSESALEYMRNNPPPPIPMSKPAAMRASISQSTVIRPPTSHSTVIRPPVYQPPVARPEITESTVIRAIRPPETHRSSGNGPQYIPWSQAEEDLDVFETENNQQEWFNVQRGAFTNPLIDYTAYEVPNMKVIPGGQISHDPSIDTELMFQ